MAVRFYMDVHIPEAATKRLRLRNVEVFSATEEKTNRLPDDKLLELATSLRSVLITYDVGFRAMAENWQREGRNFGGLAFAKAETITIGQLVRELEVIAKASEPDEWVNRVIYLPLR